MKHFLNQYFDKIYCINLITRPDRKKFAQKQFKELGLKVEFYEAFPYDFSSKIIDTLNKEKIWYFNKPNEFGCFMSHYNILKKSYIKGYEKILILEDDICFHKNFNEEIKKYIYNIPLNWEVMRLYGICLTDKLEGIKSNEYWGNYYNTWSTLCYGINRKGMKYLLHIFDEYPCIADLPFYKSKYKYIYTSHIPLCIANKNSTSDIQNTENNLLEFSDSNLYIKNIDLNNYFSEDDLKIKK
ncbi:MAG: glycosyltransferase family 25 protein [Clostridia bacterium]